MSNRTLLAMALILSPLSLIACGSNSRSVDEAASDATFCDGITDANRNDDIDNDGITDGEECDNGSDPLVSNHEATNDATDTADDATADTTNADDTAADAAEPCTVTEDGTVATISCPDGSEVEIPIASAGDPGQDGEGCTIDTSGDNPVITCGDEEIEILPGADGQDGQPGTDCTLDTTGTDPVLTCGSDSIAIPGDVVQTIDCWPDSDGDGYGSAIADPVTVAGTLCPLGGYAPNWGDCDDTDAAVHNDCGGVDPACETTERRLHDVDGDGYGDSDNYIQVGVCDPWLPGYVVWGAIDPDCDDTNAAVNPGATEILGNGRDDDCDASTPDTAGTLIQCWPDADLDGYGNEHASFILVSDSCGDAYAGNPGDCDDTDETVYAGASELTDGKDNDCDGQVDEDTPPATANCWPDSDYDGYGNAHAAPIPSDSGCVSGYVSFDSDCDDTDAAINVDATEIADGKDNDCDLLVDEGTSPPFTLPANPVWADEFSFWALSSLPGGQTLTVITDPTLGQVARISGLTGEGLNDVWQAQFETGNKSWDHTKAYRVQGLVRSDSAATFAMEIIVPKATLPTSYVYEFIPVPVASVWTAFSFDIAFAENGTAPISFFIATATGNVEFNDIRYGELP